MQLNAKQQEAVDYVQGPCFVLAGAGSGKTRVITLKIEHLIRDLHYDPKRILAVTFTNKAASEMKERIAKTIGNEQAEKVTTTTFHSLGLEILSNCTHYANITRNFSLFEPNDQFRYARMVMSELQAKRIVSVEESRSNKAVWAMLEMISELKSNLIRPDENSQQVKMIKFREYNSYLNACNGVDFDDLIYKTTLLLQDYPELLQKYSGLYDYILVDEYQDTNTTQYELLKLLVSQSRNFTVVGDDDQAIYSWRGANPENIKNLGTDFKDLKVIKLEQNYRSTKHILNTANTVIANNEHIYDKKIYSTLGNGEKVRIVQCFDSNDECQYVIKQIQERHAQSSCPWSDFAILYRSNAQADIFVRELHQARIPFIQNKGDELLDEEQIRDIMAYARLIFNDSDEAALMRIINVPRRGIGRETLAAITKYSHQHNLPSYQCIRNAKFLQTIATQQANALMRFTSMMDGIKLSLEMGQDAQVCEDLALLVGYEQHIMSHYSSANYQNYIRNSIKRFLQSLKAKIVDKESKLSFKEAIKAQTLKMILNRVCDDDNEDAVQLMTLHGSKGLEFNHVFLVGVEENTLPHKRSINDEDKIDYLSYDPTTASSSLNIAEERRLCYVGITRAKQRLDISYRDCKSRSISAVANINSIDPHNPYKASLSTPVEHIRSGHDRLSPSRFIKEAMLASDDVILMNPCNNKIKKGEEKDAKALLNAFASAVGSAATQKMP